jgi:hypothetical protein
LGGGRRYVPRNHCASNRAHHVQQPRQLACRGIRGAGVGRVTSRRLGVLKQRLCNKHVVEQRGTRTLHDRGGLCDGGRQAGPCQGQQLIVPGAHSTPPQSQHTWHTNVNANGLQLGFSNTTRNLEGTQSHNNKSSPWAGLCSRGWDTRTQRGWVNQGVPLQQGVHQGGQGVLGGLILVPDRFTRGRR